MEAKVYDAVKETLETFPESRANMKMLYAYVLRRLGFSTDIEELIYSKCPSFEGIARARRQIVKDFPKLKANEEIETERFNKQGEYVWFALLGELE